MPPHAANITSTDAVRTVKLALQQFAAEVQAALIQMEIESRRPVDWIEHDRSRYWPNEVRKASDALSEARIALERCEITINPEDRRSCYDERKALQKAKVRLRTAEAKVDAVRRWRLAIRQEVDDFTVHIARLNQYLESDLLRAIATLERLAAALDHYVQQQGPAGTTASPSAARTEAAE